MYDFCLWPRKDRQVPQRRGSVSQLLEHAPSKLTHCTSVWLIINSPNHQGNFSKCEFPEGLLADTSHSHFRRIRPSGSDESQFHLYFTFQSLLKAAPRDVPRMPVYYRPLLADFRPSLA